MAGEMQATDDSGKVVDLDDYNELESVLRGEDNIPGDEVTGEAAVKKVEEEPAKAVEPKTEDKTAEGDKPPVDDIPPAVEGEVKKAEGDVTPATVDADVVKPSDAEIALRSSLRESRKQMALMQSQLDRLSKTSEDTVKALEEEDEDGNVKKVVADVELSPLEIYQNELNQVAATREGTLNDLLALMELNPQYADVSEVCSRSRFEDIFEAAAKDMVAKEGGDPVTAALAIELNVWKKPNPYSYMYNIIKEHHPDFLTVKEGAPKPDDKVVTPVAKDKGKKAADVPLSALDVNRGGGGKNLGEWTAERIDAMPEHELDKVPESVYNQYLSGELDK